MLSSLARWIDSDDGSIVKIDPVTGFAEFPKPGDYKKHLLPILIDEEDEAAARVAATLAEAAADIQSDKSTSELVSKTFWMPDQFCKVCYSCEDAFTMYRRRHHCRICGQVFCNPCSSFYVDNPSGVISGPVRSCRLCYEHFMERYSVPRKEAKKSANASLQSAEASLIISSSKPGEVHELPSQKLMHTNNLQKRALDHLDAVVYRMVHKCDEIDDKEYWKGTIMNLVREVVSSVDPNVRGGDSLDVRPYVKIKIIPGGSLIECEYVDGVVFRKNVCHKKMSLENARPLPRILLLSGAVDFHRGTDTRLTSFETLIEQEDKYIEILVEKIMSLKPDVLMVGKAVSRRAQELLCSYNVLVLQNVKQTLLERISRMTGATLLATDHMIQQYGSECLGSCGKLWFRLVQDDPEKIELTGTTRILKQRVMRGSTYVYVQGCPSEKGCTIVLRGSQRIVLHEVKRIIAFSLMVAYHLRLEVAFYNDRSVQLPTEPDDSEYNDSDEDEDSAFISELILDKARALEIANAPQSTLEPTIQFDRRLLRRHDRFFLSTSLDVDIRLPYRVELRGRSNQLSPVFSLLRGTCEEHQSILVTSLLMGEGGVQRSKAEMKGIRYYTAQDIPLGLFLIESCFQLLKGGPSAPREQDSLLDHVLSFSHRLGRLEISLRRAPSDSSSVRAVGSLPVETSALESMYGSMGLALATVSGSREKEIVKDKDPAMLPITLHSFCKLCNSIVSPTLPISDETWKMSFGKFMEISFYNFCACGRTGGCSHLVRENHTLVFTCENLEARFDVVPVHPFGLHIREKMDFPGSFHAKEALAVLQRLQVQLIEISDKFLGNSIALSKAARDILFKTDELALIDSDLLGLDSDIVVSTMAMFEGIKNAMDRFPQHLRAELGVYQSSKTVPFADYLTEEVTARRIELVGQGPRSGSLVSLDDPAIVTQFPHALRRKVFLKARSWNVRLEVIVRRIEEFRNGPVLPTVAPPASTALDIVAALQHSLFQTMETGPAALPIQSTNSEAGASLMTSAVPIENRDPPVNDLLLSTSQPTSKLTHAAAEEMPTNDTLGHASAAPILASDENEVGPDGASRGSPRLTFSSNLLGADVPTLLHSTNYRITKAIARLIGGREVVEAEDEEKFRSIVPLQLVGDGRLGLKPGRKGEVIAVDEEELPTIVAYSLASTEYFEQLRGFFRPEEDDFDTDISNDPVASRSDVASPFSKQYPSAPAAAVTYSEKDSGSTQKEEWGEYEARTERSSSVLGADEVDDVASGKRMRSYSVGTLRDPSSPQKLADSVKRQIPSDFNEIANFSTSFTMAILKGSSDDNKSPEKGSSNDLMMIESSFATSDLDSDSRPLRGGLMRSSDNNIFTSVGSMATAADAEPAIFPEKLTPNTKEMREQQLTSQRKLHTRHSFEDADDQGKVLCKFVCTSYWAGQFEAMRAAFLGDEDSAEYIRSLANTQKWSASGGKSGAHFSKTTDDRFIIKVISKVELQMFLDFAPAYFEYMAKACYHNLPTVLCKVLGVYTVGYHNKETGKKVTENLVVMENVFYKRNIGVVFDLKGSSRSRYVELSQKVDSFDESLVKRRKRRKESKSDESSQAKGKATQVLLDDNLMELTNGLPFPLKYKAKAFFQKAVMNDTLFLSIINVVDYSMVVGFDEKNHEIVVGIIDYLRQYDIVKRMERMGKSVGMLTGQAEPTIIQPSQYRKRFTLAMERYFMSVPDKWINNDMH